MDLIRYIAFEAENVIGNSIMVCISDKYNSQYFDYYKSVIKDISDFIQEDLIASICINTRTIKLKNGSAIYIATRQEEAIGKKASELIFLHKKEEFTPDFIYKALACVEDKKHRRIIGI